MDKELQKIIEQNFEYLSERALEIILKQKKEGLENASRWWGSGQIKQANDEIEVIEKILRRKKKVNQRG